MAFMACDSRGASILSDPNSRTGARVAKSVQLLVAADDHSHDSPHGTLEVHARRAAAGCNCSSTSYSGRGLKRSRCIALEA
ncbi:hypothetical protein DIPPA_04712 [Diplonema papillatum]|nr:hypothetical protein DIPPA_04712 [Diplonema papillatum]